MPYADEEALEIVVPCLLDLALLDVDVVEGEDPALRQVDKIETEGGEIVHQLIYSLFEGDEDALLAELHRATYEELHREQGLAAARPTADEGGPSLWQATTGYLVQAPNPDRGFLKGRHVIFGFNAPFGHHRPPFFHLEIQVYLP